MSFLLDPWIIVATLFAWISNSFPAWWPLFVRDKTIPEFLKEKRPTMSDRLARALPLIVNILGVAVLAVVLIWKLSPESAKGEVAQPQQRTNALTFNQQSMLDNFLNSNGDYRNYPVATKEDYERAHITNKIVFLADVARGPNYQSLIEGKRFDNCAILGPSVLAITSKLTVDFRNCIWCVSSFPNTTQPDIESVLLHISMPVGGLKMGPLAASSTAFNGCIFYGVGMAGNKPAIDYLREQLQDSTKQRIKQP